MPALWHPSWLGALRYFGWRCVYCGASKVELTQDHMMPRSRGGGGHSRRNIVPACVPCNQAKGSLTVYEFFLVLQARGLTPAFAIPPALWHPMVIAELELSKLSVGPA